MGPARRPGTRQGTNRRPGGGAFRAWLAVGLVLLGVAAGWWLASAQRMAPPAQVAPPRAVRPSPQVPLPPLQQPRSPSQAAPAAPVARAAIVFDDAGGSLADVEEIIAIGRKVTVAVLPGLAYSAEVARRVASAGLEVILHLPLEPTDGSRPLGPGGVTVAMDEAEIHATVRAGLASVPGAVGMSNHMGSRATADQRVMRAVMEVARQRDLFFLDSRTTPHSVACSVAAEIGVRSASRTIFLDNVNDHDTIRREIRRLLETALSRGEAVGIGHAQRLTPRVLAAMLPEFDRAGVLLVPVSVLAR